MLNLPRPDELEDRIWFLIEMNTALCPPGIILEGTSRATLLDVEDRQEQKSTGTKHLEDTLQPRLEHSG